MTYLAIARLTVGADKQTHDRELHEGIERVVEEMKSHGWNDDRINTAFEQACLLNDVEYQ